MTATDLAKQPIGTQLAIIVQETHLAPRLAEEITAAFAPLFQQAEQVLDEASGVNVTDPSDLRGMKKAGELRRTLKAIRGTAEKARVAMTADHLKVKQTVDLVARTLRTELEAAEEFLERSEKLAEHLQAEREAALTQERAKLLLAVGCNPDLYQLGVMPDKDWQMLLAAATGEHTLRLAEEQAQKDAAEKAETERREALAKSQAENERLRQEQALSDKKLRDAQAAADLERRKAEQEKREADSARIQLELQRQAEGAKIARLAREKDEEQQRKFLEAQQDANSKRERDMAAAKKTADAKLADEAKKRKAVEAMAGELLAFLKEAVPHLERHADILYDRGNRLIAKAEGGGA